MMVSKHGLSGAAAGLVLAVSSAVGVGATSVPDTGPPEDTSSETSAPQSSGPETSAPETSGPETSGPGETGEVTDVCQGQDGSGLKVGFANLGGGIPFTQQVEEGIQDVADECNLELVIADNNFDGQTAIDNARNFVTQEVDGVIEFQIDAGLESAVCAELGDLPVIAIDIAHPSCATFMGADNQLAGELGGAGLGGYAQENWDCDIDLIVSLEQFVVGDVNVARVNGLIRGITEVCPDVAVGDFEEWSPEVGGDSVIVRCDCGGSNDTAFPLVRDILTANPDAEHIAVVSLNDDMGLAAMAAAEEAGRLESLAIASQGADATIHETIRTVPQYVGSTAYFPENYGTYLVPAIIQLINGEEVPDPILIEHVFIDATNIDEFYPES